MTKSCVHFFFFFVLNSIFLGYNKHNTNYSTVSFPIDNLVESVVIIAADDNRKKKRYLISIVL